MYVCMNVCMYVCVNVCMYVMYVSIVTCYATKDAVRIGNPFITNSSHVTTIIHNYFLCSVTSAQLTNTHAFVTKVTYNTLTRLHCLRALLCTVAHKVFSGGLLS
jgi:hypothetical protein